MALRSRFPFQERVITSLVNQKSSDPFLEGLNSYKK